MEEAEETEEGELGLEIFVGIIIGIAFAFIIIVIGAFYLYRKHKLKI